MPYLQSLMNRGYGRGGHSDGSKYRDNGSKSNRPRAPIPERAKLVKYRVIQRDLVYVIGIPVDIAKEELLEKYEYFGQYGPIKKIVVNNQNIHTGNFRPTVSAYITFENIEDAQECIYSLESFSINGHLLKASFGTSKYCSSFLCGQKCNNPDCMYLHQNGNPEDSFCTDEISANSTRFTEMTRPMRPANYDDFPLKDDRTTIFPPRRILHVEYSEEYDEATPEEEETAEEEEKKDGRSPFMRSLFSEEPLTLLPMKVDYTVNQSLFDMLSLSQPTIRSKIGIQLY